MIRSYSRHGRKTTALTAALSLLGLAVAGQAGASCMSSTHSPTHDPSAMHLAPAVYRPGASMGASFIRVSDSNDEHDSIVGLWQFKFVGFGPDFGTQAWHSDGTELTAQLKEFALFGDADAAAASHRGLELGLSLNESQGFVQRFHRDAPRIS